MERWGGGKERQSHQAGVLRLILALSTFTTELYSSWQDLLSRVLIWAQAWSASMNASTRVGESVQRDTKPWTLGTRRRVPVEVKRASEPAQLDGECPQTHSSARIEPGAKETNTEKSEWIRIHGPGKPRQMI